MKLKIVKPLFKPTGAIPTSEISFRSIDGTYFRY